MPHTNKQQEWQKLLESFSTQRETPLPARTFRRGWRTKAQPVLLRCADGNEYMVKGQQAGRQIVNDQIVARLGVALSAPVGEPRIIEISRELIAIEPNLAHIPAGTAHGTLFIPDCVDEYELIATSEPSNRLRLAFLATLYSWAYANDWQFLFKRNPPRLIYSVDHGHFFPNGPDWTIEDLRQAPAAQMTSCFSNCGFTLAELAHARTALEAVSGELIIQTVASPPNEWGLTIKERIALVEYLFRRKQELLSGDLLGQSR